MDQIEIYIALLGVIIIVGVIFVKSPIPSMLILVIVGMLISLLPQIPRVILNPTMVLNVFLPLLIYRASADSSWRDFKINRRPIALLSVGHVLFITLLVAMTIHWLIPDIGWPMAFVLGAVISPPDDVAIISIAEKIHMPRQMVTILKGEGMLNDATALILFRFSLAAIATHHFSALDAIFTFILVIIGETLYGLALGYLIGECRLRIRDVKLQVMISIITPFLAYIPAAEMGGCGVLATVVTGFVIGHKYLGHFAPEARLIARSTWMSLEFTLQSFLFLLVGLDFRYVLEGIAIIPFPTLALYTLSIIFVVIVGRFIWVYPATYLPRLLFQRIRKKDPYPPWQQPFIVSWAGMRGGISLAAALAVPPMTFMVAGVNIRDLLIFLVFCVIIATLLIQGLTLPWLLEKVGVNRYGKTEKYRDHLAELAARLAMNQEVLSWLNTHKSKIKSNSKLNIEITFHLKEYRKLQLQLKERLTNHTSEPEEQHDEQIEMHETIFVESQIVEIERKSLHRLWREDKVSLSIRNKLLQELDYRSKQFS